MRASPPSGSPLVMTATTAPATGDASSPPRLAPVTVRLPLGLGEPTAATIGVAVAAVAALVGWWFTGAAVAVPLALAGALAFAAAVEDAATGRIPNGLILSGIVVVGCSWGFVATLDNRMMRPLAIDLLAGLVLGGAPVVFVVWLVAPRLVGGGDWKLLAVLGAAIGALAPAAASVIPMAAFAAAIAATTIRRRRTIRLGPYLFGGYVLAIAVALAQPELFGNGYAATVADW